MIIKHKGHIIKIYDDIEQLPILRFQKFNKYIMKANEIGSSFADYDLRTQKTLEFLQAGMIQEAIQELSNRRMTVFNAYNENSIKGRALAVMVKSIDGIEYNDLSDETIDKVLKHLEIIGISNKITFEALLKAKKKNRTRFGSVFRRFFQQ